VLCFGTAVRSTPSNEVQNGSITAGSLPLDMVTTSSSLPGLRTNSSLGIAQGLTVRSSNMIANIGAGFKTLVGGEIKTWTKMCAATREQAFARMLQQAQGMGAKGIVAMRYDTNQVNNGMVEVVAYGTVVSDAPAAPVASPSPGLPLAPQFVTTNLALPNTESHVSLGLVRGVSVQSVNIFLGIGAGFKSIVGGEIRNYTDMCEKARAAATAEMMQHAGVMGATGIVGFRYECNDLVPGTVEVIAYGTAISTIPSSVPTYLFGIDVSLVSTTNSLPRSEPTRSLGVVRGITVRSRNIISNIGASLKAGFVGGEIHTWKDLCEQARVHAFDRMLEEAASRGARGVVAMRFETNELSPGIAEVLAYGTAVA